MPDDPRSPLQSLTLISQNPQTFFSWKRMYIHYSNACGSGILHGVDFHEIQSPFFSMLVNPWVSLWYSFSGGTMVFRLPSLRNRNFFLQGISNLHTSH